MTRPDSLSVPEMLRVMDAATSLRLDRELAEEQLDLDRLKARLKAKMLDAAKVTGEPVTPEEVDAAIDQYYEGLHTYRDPKPGLAVALALAWVRRREVLAGVGALTLAAAVAWWLFLGPEAWFSASGRAGREARGLAADFAGRAEVVRKVATDPEVGPKVATLAAEVEARRKLGDAKGIEAARAALAALEARLAEEYTVASVPVDTVSGLHKNTIIRFVQQGGGKKVSGYYLFVQARKPDGSVLPRRIHNDEDGTDRDVTTWAERIPGEVYERLKVDKLADGILDESAFAAKPKGRLDEEVLMPGPDGKTPLARMGRITSW